MYKQIIIGIAICVVGVMFSSCQGRSGIGGETSMGYVYAPSALPYVEEVMLPDAIYANEPFEVTLKLSCSLNPALLQGAGWPNQLWSYSPRFLYPPDPLFLYGNDRVRIETWLSYWMPDQIKIFEDEPYSDTTVFTLDMPAGDWVLVVSSADSPEWGGLEDKILVDPYFEPPDNPHVVYKEYPFTVFPKE